MSKVTNQLSEKYFSNLNKNYDKWFGSPFSGYIRERQIKNFLNFVQGANSYLEVGCGTGKFISQVKCKDKTGTDISKEMIAISQEKCPEAKYFVCPSDKLPFEDNSFDRVAMMNVIQYLEDPKATIDELCRVTKPQGKILFTVFSKVSISLNPVRFFVRRQLGENLPFVNFYTPGQISRMLENKKFKIVGSGIRPPFESKILYSLIGGLCEYIEENFDVYPFFSVEMFVQIEK